MRIWFALAAAAFLTLSAAPALAERDPRSGAPLPPKKKRETPSPITDRFYVSGTYLPAHVSTTIRVDPHNATALGLTGTSLSGERDLGWASRLDQGRIEFMFRLRDRSRTQVEVR